MTAGTATKPTTKPAAAAPPGAIIQQSPVEEMNLALAEAWEQLGRFQALKIQKATFLKLANLEGMPLSGIDVITTQQGPRLYINQEGAKYNRDKYLGAQGREVSGRTVDLVDNMPGSIPEQDKAQSRKYFRTTTRVLSEEYKKIVDGIAAGRVNAETGLKILEKIMEANTYTSYSAFSYQSESFSTNRQPDHILKKGMTQAHRRADLEISKQCVLPADEEPIDAEFSVKASEALKDAAAAGGAAAVPLTPSKVIDVTPPAKPAPESPPPPVAKAEEKKPGPAGGEGAPKPADEAAVNQKIAELNTIFDVAGVKKIERQKWMQANGFPVSKKEMTVEILQKAIQKATDQWQPQAPGAAPAEPKSVPSADKEDPERKKALAAIFGQREKAGFESEDSLRGWVKERWKKGLSEMSTAETRDVLTIVSALTNVVSNHSKWGFSSPLEIKEWAIDALKKPLQEMTLEEIKNAETQLDGML